MHHEFWKNTDGMEFPIVGNERLMLWTPAPAIADVALELLRTSLHRRPQMCHVFVCPKLMTYKWRKSLLRSCDFSFYVDVGPTYWPKHMHESLLISVYLPLLPCYPWTFRRSNSVLELERTLRRLFKTKAGTEGTVLRNFFKFTRKLPSMQEGMVRALLSKGRIR